MVGYAGTYDPDTDFDAWYTDHTADAVAAHLLPGQSVLELGCATGRMTARLVAAEVSVLGVDRADDYVARAEERGLPMTRFVVADVEAHLAADRRRYHHVVATNLVHEVDDPQAFVAGAASRLRPGGLLHLTAPNPRSLHRLVALEAGLIDDLGATSARGLALDTRRSLSADDLVALGTAADLRLHQRSGICLKPLPNEAMARLDAIVLEGFARAARHAPDLAAMSYVVLRRA